MRAVYNDITIARSDHTIAVEANHYRQPLPWIRKIKDHVAFWNGVEVLQD